MYKPSTTTNSVNWTNHIRTLVFLLISSLGYGIPTIQYNLKDETPPGTFIGNVIENLTLASRSVKTYNFFLLSSANFPYMSDFFHLSSTGNLTTVQAVDRDDRNNICGPLNCCQLDTCQINASILVDMSTSDSGHRPVYESTDSSGGGHYQIRLNLSISIHDANDNQPYFLPADAADSLVDGDGAKPFYINLSEGGGSQLQTLPIASDLDSLSNGVIEYRLEEKLPQGESPRLNVSVKQRGGGYHTDEILEPQLVLLRPLDYETVDDRHIHAVLYAVDGGRPPRTGSLSLLINLFDMNDNAPRFISTGPSNRTITVPENRSLNAGPIFQVEAVDADSGANGHLTYELSSLAGPDVRRKFAVDPETGAVKLLEHLDYEIFSQRSFLLTLVARDNGHVQQSSSTLVTVLVGDVNDNVPTLVVQENVTIPEGEIMVKPVVKFYVKDEDEISQGKVTCDLAKPDQSQLADKELVDGDRLLRLHAVSNTVFFVFAKAEFDYEATPRAALLIDCFDGAESHSDDDMTRHRMRLTVTVQDRNDNVPAFKQPKYIVRVAEHAPVGTLVAEVEAIDADSGNFGQLTYSFAPMRRMSDEKTGVEERLRLCLAINPDNGTITVRNSSCLDRELADQFSFYVEASDQGGLTSSTEVKVLLSDVNDNRPMLRGESEFRLEENQRVDTIIGRVHFADIDKGRNARIHLAPSNKAGTDVLKYIRLAHAPKFIYSAPEVPTQRDDGLDHFIGDDAVHALLKSQMPIDRESHPELHFEVVAWDEGKPSLTSTVKLTIIISDQNDNAPRLSYPYPDSTVGIDPAIHVNSPIDSLVCILIAEDPDLDKNAEVSFKLLSHTNGSHFFNVNRSSGELTTKWLPRAQAVISSKLRQKKSPEQPFPGIYELIVLLTDGGKQPLENKAKIYVKVSETDPNILYDQDTPPSYQPTGTSLFSSHTLSPKLLVALLSSICAFILLAILATVCYSRIICRTVNRRHPDKHSPGFVQQPELTIYHAKPDCVNGEIIPCQAFENGYQHPTFYSFESPNLSYSDQLTGLDPGPDNVVYSTQSQTVYPDCTSGGIMSPYGLTLDNAYPHDSLSSTLITQTPSRTPYFAMQHADSLVGGLPGYGAEAFCVGTSAGTLSIESAMHVGSPSLLASSAADSVYATQPRLQAAGRPLLTSGDLLRPGNGSVSHYPVKQLGSQRRRVVNNMYCESSYA